MFEDFCVSHDIISKITGKLLGDGCLIKQRNRKPRFQFMHSINDKEWAINCYDQLESYLPFAPPTYRKVIDERIINGFTERVEVQSRTHPFFTKLESLWYCNRVKTIPLQLLEQYLNEEALAWWYQDDGHLKMNKGIPEKIILSTDNFTNKENQQLTNILRKKYQLCFSIDGQNRLVLYNQSQIFYFLAIVQPYIHPCMERKTIKSDNSSSLHLDDKRTTVYLPDHIEITRPTKQINNQLNQLINFRLTINNRQDYLTFYKNFIFKEKRAESVKGYQIVLQSNVRKEILLIQKQTGLSVSDIFRICFENLKF